MGQSNSVEEHVQRVRDDQKKREEQQRALQKLERKRLELLKTPQQKLEEYLEEQRQIIAKKRQASIDAHHAKREALLTRGVLIGDLLDAYGILTPEIHIKAEKKFYKVRMWPFAEDIENLHAAEPIWVLVSAQTVSKGLLVAFCDTPMRAPQKARVIIKNEKSCVVRVIVELPHK